MLRKVYLEGELAEKFGPEFTVKAKSLRDVFSFLELHFPGFRKYLAECEEKGIGFIFNINDKYLQKDEELFLNHKQGDIVITPMPAGSKSGIAKIFAAVVLIVVAIYLPQLIPAFAEGGALAAYATAAQLTLASIGISLGMAGIQQLMAPDPSTDMQSDDSYLFQGSGQTIIEGDPVPVLYGRLRVPGRPISFSVKNAHQSYYDYDEVLTDSVAPGGGDNDDGGGGGGGPAPKPSAVPKHLK